MIRLRKAHACLQEGSIIDLHAEGDVFCFGRVLGDELIVSAVNRGEEKRKFQIDLSLIHIDSGYLRVYYGENQNPSPLENGHSTLTLNPKSALVAQFDASP